MISDDDEDDKSYVLTTLMTQKSQDDMAMDLRVRNHRPPSPPNPSPPPPPLTLVSTVDAPSWTPSQYSPSWRAAPTKEEPGCATTTSTSGFGVNSSDDGGDQQNTRKTASHCNFALRNAV